MLMQLITKIYCNARQLFIFLENFRELSKFQRYVPYRIEEFNTQNNQVVIQCRGINAIIRTSFAEAIGEIAIIDGLSSIQACWLGYHYARYPHNSTIDHDKKKPQQIKFSLRSNHNDQFKIISFLYESSELTYIDLKQNKVLKEKIANAARNKFVLNNIHPSQACYIGMLTGHEIAKHGIEILLERSAPPILKIVE